MARGTKATKKPNGVLALTRAQRASHASKPDRHVVPAVLTSPVDDPDATHLERAKPLSIRLSVAGLTSVKYP